MTEIRKIFFGASLKTLADLRQVRVIVSTNKLDRQGDIIEPAGIDFTAYRANPTVLWNHDPAVPVARSIEIGVTGDSVVATAQFPPAGELPKSDEIYSAIRNGLVNGASIGFIPHDVKPPDRGGLRFLTCEMLEFSFTTLPANAGALVVGRSAGQSREARIEQARRIAREARALVVAIEARDDQSPRHAATPEERLAAARRLRQAIGCA